MRNKIILIFLLGFAGFTVNQAPADTTTIDSTAGASQQQSTLHIDGTASSTILSNNSLFGFDGIASSSQPNGSVVDGTGGASYYDDDDDDDDDEDEHEWEDDDE